METKFCDYFAQVRDGDIVAITYALPAHELTEDQIELTKEEYYLLKSVHGANGNVVELANQMITNIAKKIGELENTK
jgi:hypothetical protein